MSQTVLMLVTRRNPSATCTPASGLWVSWDVTPQAFRNCSTKERAEISGVNV